MTARRKVCVIGSGAREHALAVCLGRSADVVVTPGNPGIDGRTAEGHTLSSVPVSPLEIGADLFVIGPEAPLVEGLADRLRAQDKLVFGPGAAGARLEGSKEYMKAVVSKAGVPTASWAAFDSAPDAKAYLRSLPGPPYVVKTDGLAAGKGVLVTTELAEAESDVDQKLSGAAFGPAGRRIVIEEGLAGAELSLFAICDGTRAVAMSPAQDYKRLGTGDSGPNTGGMGAYSPVPAIDESVVGDLVERFVEPTLGALARDGAEFRGLLYAGLMFGSEGARLIEYNVRFGDPETEVILPRLESDLFEVLAAAAAGQLGGRALSMSERAAVCFVAASPGYPDSPETGGLISGVQEAATLGDVTVFHAGTRLGDDDSLRTAGGRVLCVSALGDDLAAARGRAYEAMGLVHFDGMQVRDDIASVPLAALPELRGQARGHGRVAS